MTGDTGDMTHEGTIGDIRTTDDMADIRTGTIHMRGTDRRCADTTGMAVDMTGTEGTTGTHRPGIMAGTTTGTTRTDRPNRATHHRLHVTPMTGMGHLEDIQMADTSSERHLATREAHSHPGTHIHPTQTAPEPIPNQHRTVHHPRQPGTHST